METPSDSPRFRWKWPLAAGGFLLLAMGWLCYRWLNPPYQPPVQPEPNGYTDILELSGKLAQRTGWWNQMPDVELQSVVAVNEPFLTRAREVLRTDCVVALNWQADRQWFENHLKNLGQLKDLSRAFAAEGLLTVRQGESRQAINSGLENLHLAKAIANGGLGTDWLSGVATYTVGLMTLRDACEIATANDCKLVLQNLPDVRDQLEPPTAITEREWHFFRRINGMWMTFLTEMTFTNNRADFEKRMEASLLMARARADLLRLHYALRLFQLTENRLPKSLDELAGRELKTIPSDPYSGRDFIYQPGKDRYILYSVGPNGIDDGGLVNDKYTEEGDLVLEPYTPADNGSSAD